MTNTQEINKIKSDWFSLPELIKEDILRVELTHSEIKHGEINYSDFIVKCSDYSLVSNKYRKLKSHLFGCYQ